MNSHTITIVLSTAFAMSASFIAGPATGVAVAAPAAAPYAFTPPPPAGQHPRVFLTPADLPALRERIKSGGAKDGYNDCMNAFTSFKDPTSPSSLALAKINAGHGADLTPNERGALLGAIYLAAMVPLVTDNAVDAAPMVAALDAYVKNCAGKSASPDNDFGLAQVGNGYDFLSNWMSPEQRDTTRAWIAKTAGEYEKFLDTVVYGFAPPRTGRTFNWIPIYVGKFGTGALSIEGEAGYEPRWYTKSVDSLKDFLDYGIGPEGCSQESIHYFSYGMNAGAYLLDASERRGAKLLEHPNLTKIPVWWTYDLFPWTEDFNDLQDTSDQTMGVGEIYQLLHVAHPDDKLTQWIYATHAAFDGCGTLNRVGKVLWATDPDTILQPADLNLPPARYFPTNGLAYMRSDWSKEAAYLEIQSDPVGAGPSHMHPDRNAFTFGANGTLWAMDTGFGFPFDIGHNEVLIDGKGEGCFPMRGKPLQYADTGWASGFMGDAKEAYDYRADWDSAPGGVKIDGLNGFPYNPVLRAFRSAVLVRGAHTYAVVVDDIRKDDSPHSYAWHLMTPLGNALGTTDDTSATLKPAYEGSYLADTGGRPIKLEFDAPATGKYRIWLLVGKSYIDPWNWWPQVSIDGSKPVEVPIKTSANAAIHWQPAPDSLDLTAGRHAMTVSTRVGSCRYVAVMIAPDGWDGLTAQPVAFSAPQGGEFVDLTKLPLASGWTLVRKDHPAHLLMKSLGGGKLSFTAGVFRRIRPDNKADKGTNLQVDATITTDEPRFRMMLYSFRTGAPQPTVTVTGDAARVTWPDGIVDTWQFASAAGKLAANGSAVRVTRKVEGKSQTFELLGQGK